MQGVPTLVLEKVPRLNPTLGVWGIVRSGDPMGDARRFTFPRHPLWWGREGTKVRALSLKDFRSHREECVWGASCNEKRPVTVHCPCHCAILCQEDKGRDTRNKGGISACLIALLLMRGHMSAFMNP